MKKVLVVLLLVVLVGCVVVLPVKGDSSIIGWSGATSASFDLPPNIPQWSNMSVGGLSGLVHCSTGFAGVKAKTGTINAKMVIIDMGNFDILGVSEAVSVDPSFSYREFTFSPTVDLDLDRSDIGVGLLVDGTAQFDKTDVAPYAWAWYDSSNSYASPVDPVDASFAGSTPYKMSLYLVLDYVAPTPTPSPSPSPSPSVPSGSTASAGFWSGDFGSSFYWIFIILGACVAFLFGLFALLGDKGNKAVNVLIAVVSLVVFVVVLFAIGVL